MNHCAAPGCAGHTSDSVPACYRHWNGLPPRLRNEIRRARDERRESDLALYVAQAVRIWTERTRIV